MAMDDWTMGMSALVAKDDFGFVILGLENETLSHKLIFI
jgi:hypothetical protein